MRTKASLFISCVLTPLAIGGAAALLTAGGIGDFAKANKPPLTPPSWLFPIAWTILYILMGVAYYFVTSSDAETVLVRSARRAYAAQLAVNFFWPIFFFNFKLYLFSFVWLVLLWILIIVCIKRFYRVSSVGAYLLVPYLVWVSFAGYLNLGVYALN